jgi:hypothetical protein
MNPLELGVSGFWNTTVRLGTMAPLGAWQKLEGQA